MWVERLAAQAQTDQQAAVLVHAFGGTAEVPSLDDRVELFEAWLTSVPKVVDPEDLELRNALGLRGNGG